MATMDNLVQFALSLAIASFVNWLAAQTIAPDGNFFQWLIGQAGIGGLAGFSMWLLDKSNKERLKEQAAAAERERQAAAVAIERERQIAESAREDRKLLINALTENSRTLGENSKVIGSLQTTVTSLQHTIETLSLRQGGANARS